MRLIDRPPRHRGRPGHPGHRGRRSRPHSPRASSASESAARGLAPRAAPSRRAAHEPLEAGPADRGDLARGLGRPGAEGHARPRGRRFRGARRGPSHRYRKDATVARGGSRAVAVGAPGPAPGIAPRRERLEFKKGGVAVVDVRGPARRGRGGSSPTCRRGSCAGCGEAACAPRADGQVDGAAGQHRHRESRGSPPPSPCPRDPATDRRRSAPSRTEARAGPRAEAARSPRGKGMPMAKPRGPTRATAIAMRAASGRGRSEGTSSGRTRA